MKRARLSITISITMLLFVSCGGAVEPTPSSNEPGPSATGIGAPRPQPTGSPTWNPPPQAPTAEPPPPTLPAPAKVADPPTGDTNFHLVVRNKSGRAAVIGIDFDLDGTRVVSGGFVASNTYTFDFAVPPGQHVLVANAASTYWSMATVQKLPFTLASESWGVVDVSTIRCDPCSGASIAWELRTTAP